MTMGPLEYVVIGEQDRRVRDEIVPVHCNPA
jgi:hypothetical protein